MLLYLFYEKNKGNLHLIEPHPFWARLLKTNEGMGLLYNVFVTSIFNKNELIAILKQIKLTFEDYALRFSTTLKKC